MKKSRTTPGVVEGNTPRRIVLGGAGSSASDPTTIAPNPLRRSLLLVNESTSYKARFLVGPKATTTEGVPIFPSGFAVIENNAREVSVVADAAAVTAGATVTLWAYEELDAE